MMLAKVAGTVVSAIRSDGIDEARYLLVIPCDTSGKEGSGGIVALDPLGASAGELVLLSQGSSTRQTKISKDKPVDAIIIGIVDQVEEKDKVVFRK